MKNLLFTILIALLSFTIKGQTQYQYKDPITSGINTYPYFLYVAHPSLNYNDEIRIMEWRDTNAIVICPPIDTFHLGNIKRLVLPWASNEYITGNGLKATFPTNLNQFTNGPGYITSYTETDPLFNTKFSTKTTSDLIEGSNLYWTPGRFNTAFNGKTTSDLAEGTNMYWTSSRFNTSFSGKSTSDLTEGTNLYFTNTRSRNSISLTTTGSSGAATYNSSTGVINIPNYGSNTRKDTIITRPINSTAFRPSDLSIFSNQDVQVNYSVNVQITSILAGTNTGTIFLEKSQNGTSGWITVSQSGISLSGVVSTASNTQTVSGFIPRTWYARIRTVATGTNAGIAVFTFQTGQENNY